MKHLKKKIKKMVQKLDDKNEEFVGKYYYHYEYNSLM